MQDSERQCKIVHNSYLLTERTTALWAVYGYSYYYHYYMNYYRWVEKDPETTQSFKRRQQVRR